MDNIIPENLRAVKTDSDDILGKLLYYGLHNVLIERNKFIKICKDLNLPVNAVIRSSEVDSFRSATSDIRDRIVDDEYGGVRIRKVYCRDNDKSDNAVSRELICETLGQNTNNYHKLANLHYDKKIKLFNYTIEDYNSDLDIEEYCRKAIELFELYQTCIGKSQIENLTENLLESMESIKMSVHGKLYFVPRKKIDMVDTFEDFIMLMDAYNKRDGKLTANSFFVADDEKQRGKMAAEFYHSAKQDINFYIEKLETLISKESENPVLLERWVAKVNTLESKKHDYEILLQNELNALDDDYGHLQLLSDELKLRAKKLLDKSAV
jgi:hypothetical protein